MFILTQILFGISVASFSLCLYFLLNEINSVFIFKNHRKLIFITFAVSLISGILSCFTHGYYTFFDIVECTLVSDYITWFVFFIFVMFAIVKVLAKIFHRETLPNNDGIKGELVKIHKNDIEIHSEVGPQFLMFVDKNINKQIGVWTHNKKTDYIVFFLHGGQK